MNNFGTVFIGIRGINECVILDRSNHRRSYYLFKYLGVKFADDPFTKW
ncbi:MAG: hypothetical protein RL023_658 [Candidatus Parcubacteria bacterium]